MADQWKVTVDRELCNGTSICISSTLHAYFRMDGGRSRPITEDIAPDNLVIDAAEGCPVGAITVKDQDGNVIAPDL